MHGTPNTTILVVDDDPLFSLALTAVLEAAGYAVETAGNGHEALVRLQRGEPRLILLDIGLPDISGLELLHLLRLRAAGVPIIILTARRGRGQLSVGLDAGADDYLTKPPDHEELLARVRAVLRRAGSGSPAPRETLVVGEFALDASRHEARVRGVSVALTPKEFNLLWLLASNAGRVVPRPLIIDTVWGVDFFGDVKALDVYIRLLRQKLEAEPDQPRLIETVRGVGYAFAATPVAMPRWAGDKPAAAE